jgi:DNA-binding winged helix-turn-helix (wHTH) protein/TolB-like protein/tetratricopeptide (TPR) repeat protein
MPDSLDHSNFRFDNFLLDKATGVLSRLSSDGQIRRVQLAPRAFRLLCLLVERRGAVVTRQEIMDIVWLGLTVEENNLSVQLSNIRRALDDGRDGTSCIQTLPGRGYRLLSPVTVQGHRNSADTTTVGAIADQDATEAVPPEATIAVTASASPTDHRQDALTAGASQRLASWRIAALGACLVVLIVALAWFATGGPGAGSPPVTAPSPERTAARPADRIRVPVERQRLHIAILPFVHHGEGVDESTADSFADHLGIDMGRLNVRVLPRQATVAYRVGPLDLSRLGRELGVHYVIDGSLTRGNGALRVNARMLATDTGEQIWAELLDVTRTGDTAIEDAARQIAFLATYRAIDVEAARGQREPSGDPTADNIAMRARSVYNMPYGPERDAKVLALFERAVEADPVDARNLAGLAESRIDQLSFSLLYDDPRAPSTFRDAEALIARAEALASTSRMVMLARLKLTWWQAYCPTVVPFAQRTRELHPTLRTPLLALGWCALIEGRFPDAIARYEDAMRVNLRNSSQDTALGPIGLALLFQGRYDEAVTAFRAALAANPGGGANQRGAIHAGIAAAQSLGGDLAAARESAAEAARLWPTITARAYFPFPVVAPDPVARVNRARDALRLAGIRDHADEDTDPGLPADMGLSDVYEAPTPTAVPGARTIRTADLSALLAQKDPLVLDTKPSGETVPGAICLWGAAVGGTIGDDHQKRLEVAMARLTDGDPSRTIVAMGWNAERFQGRNLALRLVALGYTDVYWYRGGREAWMAADQPTVPISPRHW